MAPSDAEAIAASVTDPAAFAVIFDRHATSIHRFLARRVEPADADSLLGEVFRVAFERRGAFDPGHPEARPWLYGISTNLISRHRRSEARRMRAMATLAARRIDDEQDVVGDRAAEAVDADDSLSMLVDAIDELPEVERNTLLLYAWEELSYEDVAAALDVPVGTVRSRLNRARRRLRARGTACATPPNAARLDRHPTEGNPR
jgi:RNA polymerase sigma-70 factor (ECF subfamily)